MISSPSATIGAGSTTTTRRRPRQSSINLPHDCSDNLFGPCSCEPTVDLARQDDDACDEDEDPDPYTDVEEEGDLGNLYRLGLELFNIWSGGTEAEWAAYMWSVLERAGLTGYEDGDEVERTLVVCRLVALAGINLEFAAHAWGEGYPGEWRVARGERLSTSTSSAIIPI